MSVEFDRIMGYNMSPVCKNMAHSVLNLQTAIYGSRNSVELVQDRKNELMVISACAPKPPVALLHVDTPQDGLPLPAGCRPIGCPGAFLNLPAFRAANRHHSCTSQNIPCISLPVEFAWPPHVVALQGSPLKSTAEGHHAGVHGRENIISIVIFQLQDME